MADGKESIGYRTDGFGNIQSRKGVREGNITIANNALTAKLRVVQTGGDLIIEVAEESRVIQVAGTGNDHLEVNLLSNTDYEVVIPEEAKDWITEKEVPDTRADLASSTRIFSIASNPLTTERNATIKFVSKENTNIYDQSESNNKRNRVIFRCKSGEGYKVESYRWIRHRPSAGAGYIEVL